MRHQTPTWLDLTAKDLWKKLYPQLKGELSERNLHAFAILCAEYSRYRNAPDDKAKSNAFNNYYRMMKAFNLVNQKKEPAKVDELTSFWKAAS